MIPTDDELDSLLKRLHLASARRIWHKLVERAEKEEWSYRDFLGILVAEEIAQRQQTRLQRLSRRAVFPFLKTIDDFDFTYQSTLRLSLLGSALSSDFITEGRCLILSGKPGRGKTHLAVAIAYRAIQNGFDAVFTTAAQLIDELSAAFRAGGLAAALVPYTHPALLVVDEVGYLTYGTDAANMLFHVVNDRHKRKRSMIFTTNKSPNAWGRVLHDEDLAQAIVDRVLERGRLLTLDGPSIRTRHLGLDDVPAGASNHGADNLARISGIARPEFPEPPGSGRPRKGTRSTRKLEVFLEEVAPHRAQVVPEQIRQPDVLLLAEVLGTLEQQPAGVSQERCPPRGLERARSWWSGGSCLRPRGRFPRGRHSSGTGLLTSGAVRSTAYARPYLDLELQLAEPLQQPHGRRTGDAAELGQRRRLGDARRSRSARRLPNRGDHPFQIVFVHLRAARETETSVEETFCDVSPNVAAAGEHGLQVKGLPYRTRLDVALFEVAAYLLSIRAERVGVHLDHGQPPRRHAEARFGHERNPREAAEGSPIELEGAAPLRDAFVQHSQLTAANGGQDIAHSVVVTVHRVLVMGRWVSRLRGEEPRGLEQCRIAGHQHSAARGGDYLVSVEGKRAETPKDARAFLSICRAERLGGVLDQHHSSPLARFHDRLYVGALAIEVDQHHGLRRTTPSRGIL